MSYCPEGVWRVAISSDKTLGWSDKTGRALFAKVEDKKNPTSQKNLLTNLKAYAIIRYKLNQKGRNLIARKIW